MLEIVIPKQRLFNEQTNELFELKEQKLQLEHSLVSISKWESKWNKSFLSNKEPMTEEEIVDYIRCMTITTNVNPLVYVCIPKNVIDKVVTYINAPMTATTFGQERPGKRSKQSKEKITSELIYYWMVALNIPFECQKWHLNRLITLIRVCNIKNSPKKKMKSKDVMKRNRALNAARRQQMNTSG
jgi:hypothetical protein